MNKDIDFYFDVGSPASYLAWTQLARIEQTTEAKINHKPMLLGGVFQATGNKSPAEIPAKSAYVIADLKRYAKQYNTSFNLNPHFPINTLTCMRLLHAALLFQPASYDALLSCLFSALWVEQRNLNDPEVLHQTLIDHGFDAQALLALATQAETKEQLKTTTENAIKSGVFGAPTFFTRDIMFFGQDRIDWVINTYLNKP